MAIDINKPVTTGPSEFFGKLFQIRDQIHMRHLKPSNPGGLGSFAEHKALNDFYDEILDLTDSLIESYQGKYGLLNITVLTSNSNIDPIQTITDLCKLTDGGSVYQILKDTWLQNQCDEISQLGYQTLYKLRYLK